MEKELGGPPAIVQQPGWMLDVWTVNQVNVL
jgi:hypothetical protein